MRKGDQPGLGVRKEDDMHRVYEGREGENVKGPRGFNQE